MTTSLRALYSLFLFMSTTIMLSGQAFIWDYFPTPETNSIQVELITDQGNLVALGNGIAISDDNGASWMHYPNASAYNAIAIGENIYTRSWSSIFKFNQITGTFETILNTTNYSLDKTVDGNLSYISNDVYTVIDTAGNLVSETPIVTPSSIFFIRDIFVEQGYPSYIFGNDAFSGPYIAQLDANFEVTGDKRYIPTSNPYEYIYSKGVLYGSHGYTDDGGLTWTDYTLPFTTESVRGFNLYSDTLYLVTEAALYISADRGQSFEVRPHTAEMLGRAYVHINAGRIVIGTDNRVDNELIVSQDGGTTWTSRDGIDAGTFYGVAANAQDQAISINESDYFDGYIGLEALENDAFIAAERDKFCISADGQTDWRCTDFTFFEFFNGIFIKKDKVYVANNNVIMVSNDDGDNFTQYEAERNGPGGAPEFDAWPPIAFLDNDKFVFLDQLFGEGEFIHFDLNTKARTLLSKELDYEIFLDIETAWTGPIVYILEYVDSSQTQLTLQISIDEGFNFSPSTLPAEVKGSHLHTDHLDNIYIYSGKHLFINQDRQGAWIDLAPGLDLSQDRITDMAVSFDNYIYVSMESGGIYRSGCKVDQSLASDCYMTLVDMDDDGYASNVDCNDNDPTINPGAAEACNEIDDNCDSLVDEGLPQFDYYEDADGDGYGNSDSTLKSCLSSYDGYVQNADDCNDNDASLSPAAEEIPENGIDENCDGMDATTATHELADATLRIYPNPAADYIQIELDKEMDYQVRLYDMQNKVVHLSKNNHQLDITQHPVGIYLLEVMDLQSGTRVTEKIVKR